MARRLRIETLEDRRMMSATPIEYAGTIEYATAVTSDPRHLELRTLEVLDGEIAGLHYSRFPELTPLQIPLLSPEQIATIPNDYEFGLWSPVQRGALLDLQVQSLQVATVHLRLLSEAQRGVLTTPQIQTLTTEDDLDLLPAAKIPSLSTEQIANVSVYLFGTLWTPEQRAALTQPQVQSLRVGTTMISYMTSSQSREAALTPTQLSWLTVAQIQSLKVDDFGYLTPTQVASLTPAQVSQISVYLFGTVWTSAHRQALTQTQIPALNVGVTLISYVPSAGAARIAALTSTQMSWLTTTQIQSLWVGDIAFIPAEKVPSLTNAQVASINVYVFGTVWTSAHRHALTQTQIPALNVGVTLISYVPSAGAARVAALTPTQMSWLTTAQIQSLWDGDIAFIPPEKVPSLTNAQVASINVYLFGTQWTPAHRHALTQTQIPWLNVSETWISYINPVTGVREQALSDEQIGWLTGLQLNVLKIYDLRFLLSSQIPTIPPARFAEMPDLGVIESYTDAEKATLTRAQLMTLPYNLLSQFMTVENEQYPPSPTSYHSPMNDPVTGLVDGGVHSQIHAANLLAPSGQGSHHAIRSGDWTDPTIWENNQVPTAGATVYISPDATVRFNAEMSFDIKTLRIDGTLTFATNMNTTLRVDTIVVDTYGRLHIGTESAPIADNVVAKVIIPDGGPIDTAWDPNVISRGVLSNGEVRMFGRLVTSFVAMTTDPMKNATALQLAEIPVGWRIGDELMIAGTQQHWGPGAPNVPNNEYGSETVRITEISGTTVTLNRALSYDHDAPDGQGFSVHVANLNRNIQFLTEVPSAATQQRPHIMFFENPNVIVENVLVSGYGRTDKTVLLNDPVVVGNELQPGTGTNARARYSLHFHHTGVNPLTPPGVLRGNLVLDSPGWGYVNHQSNVIMEDNVAIGVRGAGFTSEDGNEIGAMRYNLSMNSMGYAEERDRFPFVQARRVIHDFGYSGHGFWMQSPGVELVGNVVSGTRAAAFAYGTSTSRTLFDTVNLVDPSIAAGRSAIPVGAVPLRVSKDNTAYAVREGLEIWFHLTNLNDGESVIENFTAWNIVNIGIQLPYSGLITIKNAKLFGSAAADAGYGLLTNRRTQNIRLENVSIEGFINGIVIPVRRSTVIDGARLGNVQNILIMKGHDTIRTLDVLKPIDFVPLTPTQLGSRQAYNVALLPTLAPPDNKDRQMNSVFSADDLQFMMNDGSTAQLYFAAQAANVVPFPAAPSPPISGFSSDYVGKTNLQLWQQYGVWVNGGDLPAGASTPAGFNGILTVIAVNTARDGDFNGDGAVDGADFLAWQRGAGTLPPHGTKSQGDADQDQDVDGVDLGIWKGSFGTRPAGNAVSSVTTPLASFVAADSEPVGAPGKLDRSLYAAAMAHDHAIEALEPRKLLRWRFSRPRAGANA